ncbi:HAD family hydrolase [Brachybacterium sp. AOP43-C2-M15]|uniref:HAD family hydrolase n=1 Tax=Brachybacterium sp. AOP43-C2-M15 TaxID=3457661 RepID=UPI0040341E6E
MPPSLPELSALVEQHEVRAVVSDLDGVLRVFDRSLWSELDEMTGTAPGTAFRAVLGNPYLDEVVRGRGTHACWRELARRDLVEAGSAPADARAAVDRWASTPARIDPVVLAGLQGFRARGISVFVLTNGTDRVPAELSELGLDPFLGPGRRLLLNSADLGAAKPDPEAFRRARERIQQVLGEEVPAARIALLDDTAGHVRAARSCGWHAVLHRADGIGPPLP